MSSWMKRRAAEMEAKSGGARSVPQIFIGDTYVGGCDELYALEKEGKLDPSWPDPFAIAQLLSCTVSGTGQSAHPPGLCRAIKLQMGRDRHEEDLARHRHPDAGRAWGARAAGKSRADHRAAAHRR